jgi:hypothetical protein
MDDGDDQLRSGLAIILGGCFALFPLLAGYLDLSTTLIVWAIGAVAILPVWRYAGAALSSPMAVIAFLSLVVGMFVIGRLFSGPAILGYLGAWGGTLAAMRFVTGWRDTE